MVVQSVSVVVFLAGELLDNARVVQVAVVMLWISLALALLSAFKQVRRAGELGRDDDRHAGRYGA